MSVSTNPDPATDDLQGQMLGPFRVLGRLGAGGMGVVYRGEDVRLGRQVALKVLPASAVGDEERRARFLREAKAAAALSDPGIAQVYDIGDHDGTVYIAMELCTGGSLREQMASGRLSVAAAIAVVRSIAVALSAAAARGIVHRDLKPDNVMFDGAGRVKVLDFGLARIDGDDGAAAGVDAETDDDFRTRDGRLLGTPGYMAPEQATGKRADTRSDVFAVGVILYELLAGKRPFSGRSGMEVLIATTRDAPPPLGNVNPEVTPALQAVVDRCLAKEPDDRFASARDLVAALDVAALDAVATPSVLQRVDTPDAHAVTDFDLADVPPPGAEVPAPPPTQQAPRRAGSRALAAAVAVAVAVAAGLGIWRWSASEAPAPPRHAAVPAGDDKDVAGAGPLWPGWPPLPASPSGEAQTLYRQWIEGFRTGTSMPPALGKRLFELDPGLAAAHLQVAIGQWGGLRVDKAREAFGLAVRHRDRLDPERAAWLHALEPLIQRHPSDLDGARRRLAQASTAFPGSAVLPFFEALVVHHRHGDGVAELVDKALAADPGFVHARILQVESLAFAGRFAEALAAAAACRHQAPAALQCTVIPVRIHDQRGECAAVLDLARALAAANPADRAAPLFTARALAGLGKPLPAVQAALERLFAMSRTQGDEPRTETAYRFRLAVLQGDFAAAERQIRASVETTAASTQRSEFGQDRVWLAELLNEMGRHDDARRLADDFFGRMDAFEPDPRTDLFAIGFDPVPAMLAALAEAGGVDNETWRRRLGDWLADWDKAGLAPFYRGYLWPYGHARAVSGPAQATLAVAELDDDASVPAFLPHQPAAAHIGRALLDGGRPAQARPWLAAAARHCGVLSAPLELTRAHFDLGRLEEVEGDTAAACRAYAVVLARWGAATPRSVTAERARARAAALGCPSP